MANLKLASYATISSNLISGMASLAAGSSAISSEIDNTNSSNLNLFDELDIDVEMDTNPSEGGFFVVYQVVSVDGTNFEDGSDSVDPDYAGTVVGQFVLDSTYIAGTTYRFAIRNVVTPPGKYKYVFSNHTDQPLAASGSSFRRRQYHLAIT